MSATLRKQKWPDLMDTEENRARGEVRGKEGEKAIPTGRLE